MGCFCCNSEMLRMTRVPEFRQFGPLFLTYFINIFCTARLLWPAILYPITQLLHRFLHRSSNAASFSSVIWVFPCRYKIEYALHGNSRYFKGAIRLLPCRYEWSNCVIGYPNVIHSNLAGYVLFFYLHTYLSISFLLKHSLESGVKLQVFRNTHILDTFKCIWFWYALNRQSVLDVLWTNGFLTFQKFRWQPLYCL